MKLVLDSHTLHTKVVDKSLAPSWEQSFKFPCDDAYVPCALCVWSPRAAESMRCVWYVLVFTLLLLTPAVTWC